MAMLIVTFAAMAISGASAVAAVVQARSAVSSRDAAESARDEAVELARQANAEFARQAVALEEANRLIASAQPIAQADKVRELVQARATAVIAIVDRQSLVAPDDVKGELTALSTAFAELSMALPIASRNQLQYWCLEAPTEMIRVRNEELRSGTPSTLLHNWCWETRTIAAMIHDGEPLDKIAAERAAFRRSGERSASQPEPA